MPQEADYPKFESAAEYAAYHDGVYAGYKNEIGRTCPITNPFTPESPEYVAWELGHKGGAEDSYLGRAA